MPKFRGGSARGTRGTGKKGYIDSYLDNEEFQAKSSSRPKKQIQAKSAGLEPELANATVVEVFPKQCRVRIDADGVEILCAYRRAQIMSTQVEGFRERSPVAVGDRVRAEKLNPQSGVIDGVCVRRNFLARPAPGQDDPSLIHVIASNLDLLVIVASVNLPEFSPGLIDRYLIAAEAAAIPVLICVTKSDLIQAGVPALWERYTELGYRAILLCSRQTQGFEELRKEVQGKTVAFCGHSGVGKTSLLRVLTNRPEFGKIGEVNPLTGKGKHTTTSSVLYWDGATKSNWMDTPGIREFGLIGVGPENLKDFFPEFAQLSCTSQGCHHQDEPECQARDLFRHGSYQRILQSFLNPQG